jgi:Mg-chelatase subunit ChlD
MTFRFDHPAALLLALVAVVVIPTGWRALSALDPTRRVLSLVLRVLVIGALAVLLAGPRTVREHDHLTVIGLLDVSGSVRRFGGLQGLGDPAATSNLEYLRQWFRQATGTRADDDRIGLIAFDGQAMAVAVPTRGDYTDDGLDVRTIEGTNIADAISLALAMFPADTARRIVLMTDGNQTLGDALNTARQAAGGSSLTGSVARFGVPIDVAPIAYRTLRDVQIAAVEAPATARPGQTVTVRVILEAIQPTRGLLTLTREGEPVDLNGAAPGVSRAITAPAGPSVQLVQVMLGETPVNRFEAVFEPADPREDLLPDNNRAEAFTATPTRGKSLVVTRAADPENTFLVRTLRQAELPVEARSPADLPADLLSLQRYDLIVLENIPAYDVGRPQQERLRDYVHDLGGGLVMVGGEDSFGAGGWNGSPLESVLPLELDPPRELRLPTAALVLVLDRSGSMNERVAGARATQQQVANEAAALAIESLRDDSLVGVVTFDSWPHVRVPLQRNDDPTAIADRVRGITADGGTNIGPALRRAHAMLADAEVDRKRVVCVSDGRSPTRNLDAIARNLAADDIRLTTIAVGDKADHETLERLAEIGRGEFYPVYNPATLPRILVDSVQVLNKPLSR